MRPLFFCLYENVAYDEDEGAEQRRKFILSVAYDGDGGAEQKRAFYLSLKKA